MSLCFDGCFFFPRLLSCSVHFDVGPVKLLRRHDPVIGHFEHVTCVTKHRLSVTFSSLVSPVVVLFVDLS